MRHCPCFVSEASVGACCCALASPSSWNNSPAQKKKARQALDLGRSTNGQRAPDGRRRGLTLATEADKLGRVPAWEASACILRRCTCNAQSDSVPRPLPLPTLPSHRSLIGESTSKVHLGGTHPGVRSLMSFRTPGAALFLAAHQSISCRRETLGRMAKAKGGLR